MTSNSHYEYKTPYFCLTASGVTEVTGFTLLSSMWPGFDSSFAFGYRLLLEMTWLLIVFLMSVMWRPAVWVMIIVAYCSGVIVEQFTAALSQSSKLMTLKLFHVISLRLHIRSLNTSFQQVRLRSAGSFWVTPITITHILTSKLHVGLMSQDRTMFIPALCWVMFENVNGPYTVCLALTWELAAH